MRSKKLLVAPGIATRSKKLLGLKLVSLAARRWTLWSWSRTTGECSLLCLVAFMATQRIQTPPKIIKDSVAPGQWQRFVALNEEMEMDCGPG